jgi:hypothetical protein
MAKRLGGSLLGFGVKSAGEFCMSYRLGEVRANARSPYINNTMWSSILELSLSLRERDISLREIATYSAIYISHLIFSCSSASCWT